MGGTHCGSRHKALGLAQQTNINGRKCMLNYCLISGEVLTEPEIKRYGTTWVTEFELGMTLWSSEAGVINVTCVRRLALATAKHLHQGDRVAIMGHLFCFPNKHRERQERNEAELLAIDMEFVRRDSHVKGLIFPGAKEEED
jgi:single-stranded DNA-binding protein